jgi:hypothetical protein
VPSGASLLYLVKPAEPIPAEFIPLKPIRWKDLTTEEMASSFMHMTGVLRLNPIRAVFLASAMAALPACAQSSAPAPADQGNGIYSFLVRWDQRALHAQVNQPNWLTPVVTSTARLKQEFRYDILWQENRGGTVAENYGGSKGLTTIPVDRIEISINLPPYIVHHEPALHDGFGDFSLTTKFRLASGNSEHGDYALTAFLAVSFPTGSYNNGSPHPVITPTLAGGKGLGDFVYEGTFGCDLPSANTSILGRRLILNNALQYRHWRKFWPEMEANSNFYSGGPNDGKRQVYLTPGISVGRFLLYKNLQLTLGGGMEIAVTHFHSSAHQGVFTLRLPF